MNKEKMKHKVVLIGDSLVGKTSMMHRLLRNMFVNTTTSTVGTGCGIWSTRIDKNDFFLQIWDTAGQEKYRSLGGIYYQNAEAAIVVCSKSDDKSMQNVQLWVKQFQEVMGTSPFVAVVLNKADIGSEDQKIDEKDDHKDDILNDSEKTKMNKDNSELAKWAKQNGFYFTETSAKTGQNINELFQNVANEIYAKFQIATKILLPPAASVVVHATEKCGACC